MNARDRYGRLVVTPPHLSNCFVYALRMRIRHGGQLRVRMNGWVLHASCVTRHGTYEFVFGGYGHNLLFPLLFKGYGVRV